MDKISLFNFSSNPGFSVLYNRLVNNWIFLCIRYRMVSILYSVLYKWKFMLNMSFLFFFYEAVYKLRPVLGFHFFLIKRKHKKKIYKLQVFLLNFNARNKKALIWLVRAVKSIKTGLKLQAAFLEELYSLNFFKKSLALTYKIKYYNNLISYKTSKYFLW